MRSFRTESTDRLFKVISQLNTVEECYDFFEDLCTIKEIQDMSQRLDTAILLSTGKSYQKIAEEISVSTATISRVNKCLEYGSGGYRAVIDKINGGKKK
ncbi:MAG: TrpR-related protein YerC/YecD [Clostridiales bacterium]|nr:TrpR-related protein YerC/YecD [Clostridiales bacterium]